MIDKKRIKRLKLWQRALFKEHHIVNIFWKNFHRVDEGLFRSAQLMPKDLEKVVRKHRIKTVVNLRGHQKDRAVYRIEKATCRRLGVRMVDVEIYSRSLVDKNRLVTLKEVFEKIEYPALVHCKAGADRSSLAAVLYLYWMKRVPLSDALNRQMRFWPFGYIRYSGAGIMRFFFERFMVEGRGIDMIAWSESMDRMVMEEAFEEHQKIGWIHWIYDRVLRRE